MEYIKTNTTCEEYYKHANSSKTIREWNINPTENLSLIVIDGYMVLIISVLGSFGNLLTILIFVFSELRRSSLKCLLSGLAISDMLVTVSGIFVHALTSISDFYPTTWSYYRKSFAANLMVFFYPLLYIGKKLINTFNMHLIYGAFQKEFSHVK